MSEAPVTDAFREVVFAQYKEDELTGDGMGNILAALTDIETLERERYDWKSRFIQQNKDLGCEMMDPGGTIWDYAKKLQDEIAGWETKWKCAVDMAAKAGNERDMLRSLLRASELEMFAIRSSLSDAKAEIEEIQEQLNAYIMLDKMAMRKFIREREQERQNQCRQSPTIEE